MEAFPAAVTKRTRDSKIGLHSVRDCSPRSLTWMKMSYPFLFSLYSSAKQEIESIALSGIGVLEAGEPCRSSI
jgi:hypothetical protein